LIRNSAAERGNSRQLNRSFAAATNCGAAPPWNRQTEPPGITGF
jgi:hypothetical protein